MKTINLLLLLLAIICYMPADAQKDLLRKKSISWVGEWTTDYNFQNLPRNSEKVMPGLNWANYTVEKMQQLPNEIGFSEGYDEVGLFWKTTVGSWITANDQSGYQDAALTKKVDQDFYNKTLVSLDTVVTFDPATYLERVQVVRNDFNPENLVGLRLRHCLYLDKDNQLSYRLLAWTPLILDYDRLGNPSAVLPTFWYSAEAVESSATLRSSTDVPLIVEARQQNQLLQFSEMSKLKGDLDHKTFFEQLFSDANAPLYSTDGSYFPLVDEERASLLQAQIDTVITFSPETYEEVVKIIRTEADLEQIESLRLVLRWYWDVKARELRYEFVGYAPMQAIRSSEGKFKYNRPIVYIKS